MSNSSNELKKLSKLVGSMSITFPRGKRMPIGDCDQGRFKLK